MDERHQARARGLRLAAKITGMGGLAVALAGAASAQAAETKAPPVAAEAMKVGGGSCGCSPCWGPPCPPEEGYAS